MDKRWRVFMFRDSDGRTRFIRCDRSLRGVAPWILLWQQRFTGNSPVHRWLKEQGTEMPVPILIGGSEPLNRTAAEAIFTIAHKKLMEAGEPLLSTREFSTYRHGGGISREVEDDQGFTWPSLRAAARAWGLDASTAQRRVKRGFWRYLDAS